MLRNAGATLGWDEFTTSGELCEAAKSGNLERLELMLACGANVNSTDCAAATRTPRTRPVFYT